MSKSFCVLPWMHIQTKPDGQMKPCCRFDIKHPEYKTQEGYTFDKFNVDNMSFSDAINSDEWIKIRDTIQSGERVPGCRKCYQEDDFTFSYQTDNSKRKIKSMRIKENWLWNQDNQTELVDNNIKLKYIELAFGNYCNLKCRTCNSSLSTTWYDDDTVLAAYYKDRKIYKEVVNVENEWNVQDFMDVEEIKFTGGEPMLHPNFIKTLDMIISTGRSSLITLDIFTNASWVPRDKVLDRLKQFKKVTINLSIDGLAYVNDYIRYPSEWNTVAESVKEWLTTENAYSDIFFIKWAPVISVFNVWLFHRMIEWWFSLQLEIKGKDWWDCILIKEDDDSAFSTMIINIVRDPVHLSPSLYPNKKLLVHKLLTHRDEFMLAMNKREDVDQEKKWSAELCLYRIYNKVVSSLNDSEPVDMEQLKNFVEYTADLDKIRGQDIRVSLPDLWKRFENMIEYKGRMND